MSQEKEKELSCAEAGCADVAEELQIGEEIKKVKEENVIINFMDIVDKNLACINEESSVDSDEFNKKRMSLEANVYANALYSVPANEQEEEEPSSVAFIRNKFQEYEKQIKSTENLEKSTKEKLKDLNNFIREAGNEEKLRAKLEEANRISKNPSQQEVLCAFRPFEKEDALEPSQKDEPLKKQQDTSNKLVRIHSDILEAKNLPIETLSSLRIQKYSGYIYINLGSIERYMSTDRDVKSISLRFESEEITFTTKDYPESPTINLDSMVGIRLDNIDRPYKIRLVLLKNYFKDSKSPKKVCETDIVIDRKMVEMVHNRITDIDFLWSPYTSLNIFKSFLSFFTENIADAWCIKTNIAFVSAEELDVLGGTNPTDINELSRWLNIKRHSYTTWYTGFVNIKGNLKDVCTIFWKRRFIYWRGYKISVFNDLSRCLLGTIDLLELTPAQTSAMQILDKENKIKIALGQSLIELHFDCLDKFDTFKKVLQAIL